MERNGHITFPATILALELTIVRFPNFEPNKNYAWKRKTTLKVVFLQCYIRVHFPKKFNSSQRSFLVVKSSKQQLKLSESRKSVT